MTATETKLMLVLIETAQGLAATDGDNPEYNRALRELIERYALDTLGTAIDLSEVIP